MPLELEISALTKYLSILSGSYIMELCLSTPFCGKFTPMIYITLFRTPLQQPLTKSRGLSKGI